MAFKIAVLLAILVSVRAGYLESDATYTATPLAYSAYAVPTLAYSSPALSYRYESPSRTLAYTYATAPAVSYSSPIARSYVAAPALTYAPALPYNDYRYGYTSHAAPLTKTVAVAQPATYAARSVLSFAPVRGASYTGSYKDYSSPLITYDF